MSEKGVTAGFKSAKKQGCKIVVIDLDEHVALPLLQNCNFGAQKCKF
jgi:hypothetical protein